MNRPLQIAHGQIRTKTLAALIARDSRIVGYSIESDGVFLYTDSALWADDSGSGTFRGDSETAAIRAFRTRVRPTGAASAMRESIARANAGQNEPPRPCPPDVAAAQERTTRPVTMRTRDAAAPVLAPDETCATVYAHAGADAAPVATVTRPRTYGGDGVFTLCDITGRQIRAWRVNPTLAMVRRALARAARHMATESTPAPDAEGVAVDLDDDAAELADYLPPRAFKPSKREAARMAAELASFRYGGRHV